MREADRDLVFMRQALVEAEAAAARGEVPVGAVLTADGQVVARAGNRLIAGSDPVGHAEIRVLRQGGRVLGNYRLPGTTLYVTLEPCPMCAAALVHARVARLVFGARDPKGGGVVSRYAIGRDGLLNHRLSISEGLLADSCGRILREFFQKRREKKFSVVKMDHTG